MLLYRSKKGVLMRILLTNNSLSELAGSEIFTYTLAKEFRKSNHFVEVWVFQEPKENAIIPQKLKELGVDVISNIDALKQYDVIHCHHNNCAGYIQYRYPKTPKIFVSHGWIFDICVPPTDSKWDRVVAISEEVQQNLKQKGFPDAEIINNPIDTDRFEFKSYKKETIEIICAASNHVGKPCKRQAQSCMTWEQYKPQYAQQKCMHQCETKPISQILHLTNALKAKLLNVGAQLIMDDKGQMQGKSNSIWDIEKAYRECDLVFGIGRSVLCAAAMGIPINVYDHFGYAGFIRDEAHFVELMRTNFSGRLPYYVCNEFPQIDINKFCYEYNKNRANLKNISDWVKKYYDSEMIARKYLDIYEQISS